MTVQAETTEQLRQSVADALRRIGNTLRNVDVAGNGTRITLRGYVRCYYHKQLCIAATLRVPGVEMLRDELRVVGESPTSLQDNHGQQVETH